MDDSDHSDDNEEEEEGGEDVLDPNNPEHFFALMERDFSKTLAEMELNPEAAQFTDDYTKLFEAFYQTYTKQKDLEEKSEGLEQSITEKDGKLELALQLANEDKSTIDDLKSQIQHAWRLADAAHAREQLAQEIIDNLRRQVENLNAEIDFKNKMSQDTEEGAEATQKKEGLERERDKLVNEVTQLNTKLTNALSYQEELERKTSEADLRINEYAGQVEDQNAEINRHKRAREKLEADIVDLKFKIEDKDLKINELNAIISMHQKQVARAELELKEYKQSYSKLAKELEVSTIKLSKLQDEHNNALFDAEQTKQKFQKKILEQRGFYDEAKALKNDLSKVMKVKDLLDKKILLIQTERDDVMMDRTNLRQRISMFERQIEESKKFFDEDKRIIDTLIKEKDILNKALQRQQGIQKDQLKLIQIQEQSKKKLEVELDTFFIESNKQKKIIGHLERERDRLAEEQLNLTTTIEDNMEDIRLKKALICDLKKDAAEQENKIRQQQNLYEAIRSDRNALQKSLQESTAECMELKKKLKIIFHQTEQLKEDIATKEKLLIKDETIMRKMTKEKENLKIEVMTGLDTIRSLKEDVKELRDEEKRLHKTIMDNDRMIRHQAKNLTQLMNERDILGSQLVRRNDEIALLNEKIVILQATLTRGETHYDQRLCDIKLLKLEVKRLRQEKNLMSSSMLSMTDLRQEIFHLERDLTKAKLKCKALEQEVQNPLNVHRWRKLEGSDPEAMELLQKIHILQRRLLQQASVAVERERQLKEAERLYLNLRQVLSKQPGPALQEELSKTQRALKLRGDKLKSLVSELNMADLKSAEYKSDLQRVTEELADLKKKYLAEKKANRSKRMAFESSREINRSREDAGDEVKFAGGGFRMSVHSISSNVYSPLLCLLTKMPKVLEVCVDSLESAVSAFNGGADRLELCSSLIEGGLTPTPGLLIQIQNMNARNIPVYCLLRCRPGNFIYKQEEVEIMKEDAKILRRNGADGFVFGALSENGDVDMKICREIIKVCHPLPVTFHRAFDFCKRPTIEVEVIIDLGFQRILTSGKQKNAQMGVKLIHKLMEQVGNRIIIMPGCGINKDNLKFILENTEASEIHGSFKILKEETEPKSDENSEVLIGEKDGPLYVTDESAVREIVTILKTI